MNAPHFPTLSSHQRERLAAIGASGRTQPVVRLFLEMLGLPKICRTRACRRAKACIGDELNCARDNSDELMNEILPALCSERDDDNEAEVANAR
ncbi:MAG: hypothetical protein JOZ16_07155 [Methylobacteriaceae bacterium]|nr:hypothetical protein [Methylobacteriaceae bacterium]